jgi:two-component system cell cycle sensor histidine kinase/response regulator CckA
VTLIKPYVAALLGHLEAAWLAEDAQGTVVGAGGGFSHLFGLSDSDHELEGRPASEVFTRVAEGNFIDSDGFVEGTRRLAKALRGVSGEPLTTIRHARIERDLIVVDEGAEAQGVIWCFRAQDVNPDEVRFARADAPDGSDDLLQAPTAEMVLAAMPTQVAVFSASGTYMYVSPSAVRDPETRAWMIGRTDVEYGLRRGLNPALVERRREHLWRSISTGEAASFEETITSREGEKLYFKRFYFPVAVDGGAVRYVLAYGLDVTAERVAALRLERSQKMDTVGQMAGEIAHDLNNALTVVSGFSALLREVLTEDAKQVEFLDKVENAAAHAADITRQLLEFSRSELEEAETASLHESIADAVVMVSGLVGPDVAVVPELARGSFVVPVGGGRLQQLLVNLIINARDAMKGAGRVTIRTRAVDLTGEEAARAAAVLPGSYVELSVSDTGPGMAPDVMARAFEPFFSTKARGKGTGLGLAVVQRVLSDVHGAVRLDSPPGEGLTVCMLFPVRGASDVAGRPAMDSVDVPGGDSGELTILVADGAPDVLALVAHALGNAGHRVVEAMSCEEVTNIVEQLGETHLDLVVTEIALPDGDGRDVVARLKSGMPHLATLFLASGVDHGVRGDPVLLKPFSVGALARAVREATQGRRG